MSPRGRSLSRVVMILLLTAVPIGAAVVLGIRAQRRLPAGSRAEALRSSCLAGPKAERQACLLAGFERLLADSGVGATMAALQQLARVDREVSREGHVIAHGVGIKGYLLSNDVPGTFDQCPNDFSSGCAHGVIQAYLESQDTLTDDAMNDLCRPYRRDGAARWRLFQCVHGTGHGLVMMLSGDLPKALALCDVLRDGWDRDSCYGGAFMENIMRTTSPHHPATELAASHHSSSEHHPGGEHDAAPPFRALDSTDLLYPCSAMADRYLRACYEIQTAAILHFTKGKIGPAAGACDQAPAAMRPTCYSSLGRDISSKALRDPGKSIRYCREGAVEYQPWCYFGLAKALVDWDADPEAGFRLCRRLDGDPGADLCFQAVGEQIASLTAVVAERQQRCEAAGPAAGVEACRWGAAIPGATEPRREPRPSS